MRKLIIFDVDGVLLDNKMGGFKDVLVILGKKREVRAIDEEYQKRKFIAPWGLEELADLYQGFSQERLKRIAGNYCQENLMEGAKEASIELKRKGCKVGALSSNPQFIMDALSKILPLDFSVGTELEFREGIATGKILKKVDRHIKAQILREKMEQLGLRKQDVIIVGDSLTDLPMSKEAGLFIVFNPQDEIKERADIIIEEKDLREILSFINRTLK